MNIAGAMPPSAFVSSTPAPSRGRMMATASILPCVQPFPSLDLIVANHGCVSNAILVDVRVAFAIRKAIKQAAMMLTGL